MLTSEHDHIENDQREDENENFFVLANDRFEIYPFKKIEHFETFSSQAFVAIDRAEKDVEFFALIPKSNLPGREKEINSLLKEDLINVISLIASGFVAWPKRDNFRRFLIYKKPLGPRLSDFMSSNIGRNQKINAIRKVIASIEAALISLNKIGIVHHSIRPDNIFFNDAKLSEVLLGDFVAAPPSYDQPAVYETAERGMSQRSGRGIGNSFDDIYSFGVTLCVVLQENRTTLELSDEEIIMLKISKSTYQAILPQRLITKEFNTLIEGLVRDHEDKRFAVFPDGFCARRVSVSMRPSYINSETGVIFSGQKYFNSAALAFGLSLNKLEALNFINSEIFSTWIRKGKFGKELWENIEDKINYFNKLFKKEIGEDVKLTLVLILMNPAAPIFYKELAFFLNGYPGLIADIAVFSKNKNSAAEVVLYDILSLWKLANRSDNNNSIYFHVNSRAFKSWLVSKNIGQGFERLVYEFNDSIGCLGVLFSGSYIPDVRIGLEYFENSYGAVRKNIIDRNFFAFIAAREGDNSSALIDRINLDDEPAAVGLMVLRLFAYLQNTYKTGPLPGVSRCISPYFSPIIRSYYGKSLRIMLGTKIPEQIKSGNLVEILSILDDFKLRRDDREEFLAAVAEYSLCEITINDVIENSRPSSVQVYRVANTITVIFVFFVVMIAVSLFAFLR